MSQWFVSFPCYPFPSSYKPIPLALIHVHLSPDTLELPHLSPTHYKLHLWKSLWKIKVQQGCWQWRNGQVSVSLSKSWTPIPHRPYTSSVEEGKLQLNTSVLVLQVNNLGFSSSTTSSNASLQYSLLQPLSTLLLRFSNSSVMPPVITRSTVLCLGFATCHSLSFHNLYTVRIISYIL